MIYGTQTSNNTSFFSTTYRARFAYSTFMFFMTPDKTNTITHNNMLLISNLSLPAKQDSDWLCSFKLRHDYN